MSDQVYTGGETDTNALTASGALPPHLKATLTVAVTTPPPEAYQACVGKTVNTACEYEWIFGKQDGVWYDVFGQLVCMPGVVLPTIP